MTDSIPKKVLQSLGEIGVETVNEGANQAVEMVNSVIVGQELVGDVKPMSEEEMAKAKVEDVRNVEAEIKEIVVEKKNSEEEKEKEFLEKIKLQREAEEAERNKLFEEPGNAKREAAKTQFAPGKRKKQQPDASQMSQTSEFKGGKID